VVAVAGGRTLTNQIGCPPSLNFLLGMGGTSVIDYKNNLETMASVYLFFGWCKMSFLFSKTMNNYMHWLMHKSLEY
jgi:hypothetical protein